MKRIRRTRPLLLAHKQHGVVILVILLTLCVGLASVLVASLTRAKFRLENDGQTMAALAQAKAALLGHAVRQVQTVGGNERPGDFPCPDKDNNGNDDGNCVAGALGRLPWRTLGLSDMRDGSGERLWYALAGPFRRKNLNSNPINSDTKGNMLVYASDGSLVTDEAIAVVFSPGPAISSQARDLNIAENCAATSTSIPRNHCSSNYLDETGGRNNALQNGPFVDGNYSVSFNDRFLVITAKDLIPLLGKRIEKELRENLISYADANDGYFPRPAKYNDATCTDSNSMGCASDPTQTRGRLPQEATSIGWTAGTMKLGGWFFDNQWNRSIYYSVAAGYSKSSGTPSSPSCSVGCLSVDGTADIHSVFFMAGPSVQTATRPSNDLTAYLEDAENQDGWSLGPDDQYVRPTAQSNDRLSVLP